ncbi:MAG TPA: hypothetical protein PLQ03_07920 [Brevundimonas sp.]|uniref:hypothetical protein n=1 Tax=Brevundimonas sp. TaxID=1871086 RepID=UPI00262E415F|nr:hypothetical protein [Brevundimonas sp.]HRO33321.1 hypothetical protein [Brevundimonas sp.]
MRLIALCSVSALLVSSVAAAQVPGNPSPPRMPEYNARLGQGSNMQDKLTNELMERERNGGQSSERADLIERLAPLVAQGQCNEARRIARQEGDRDVSRRIGQVCVEGRPTPMPETPAV